MSRNLNGPNGNRLSSSSSSHEEEGRMKQQLKQRNIPLVLVGCLFVVSYIVHALELQWNIRRDEEDFICAPSSVARLGAIGRPSDLAYCQTNNRVMVTPLGIQRGMNETSISYTISEHTFGTFHGNNHFGTTEQLLESIRNGRRVWSNPIHQNRKDRDKLPSYFVPALHDIPPLSQVEACDIVSDYSHVYTYGDSLTRHMRQAMFMILRNDFVLGGVYSEYNNGKTVEENMYHCRCDGQFSEHRYCRRLDERFWNTTLRQIETCSQIPEERAQAAFVGIQHKTSKRAIPAPDWDQIRCDSSEYHGVLFFLQPGGNQNADLFEQHWLRPIVDHPVFQKCAAVHKAVLIVASNGAQSRFLDDKFPDQERSLYQQANRERELKLQKYIPAGCLSIG